MAEQPTILEVETDELEPGHIFGGRFKVLEMRGRGGMGVVYRAYDKRLGRVVAIKILSERLKGTREGIERFLREAKSIARLDHTNIVRVYDIGDDPLGPYIVMEWIEGRDLSKILAASGKLDLDRALALMQGICAGVSYAHSRGIIHRDIKPQNILVTEDGIPKLVDFGLARVGGESDLSMEGRGMGTLAYTAPEQIRSAREASPRSDVYSLAKMFYQMTTGKDPIAVEESAIPAQVRECVVKAVSPAPANRYSSVDDFWSALAACAKEQPAQSAEEAAAKTGDRAAVTCPQCGSENPAGARYCSRCRAELHAGGRHVSKRGLVMRIGLVAAALAVAGGVLLGRRQASGPLPEAPGRQAGETKTFEIYPGLEMGFVWVPAGTFQMGSPLDETGRYLEEGPVHNVEITKGFWLGQHEVTQAQWNGVMDTNPSRFQEDDRLPVQGVSWDLVQEFLVRLNKYAGARLYRLPTEAEWEYACRAGTETRYCFGNRDSELGDYAWYWGNAEGQPHRVGEKRANAWGLYDMHGNVWEWCRDWYAEDYYLSSPPRDPRGPATGDSHVLRGGSWDSLPAACRSAFRIGQKADLLDSTGFRVVRIAE